jgi:hypothetical protein
MDEEEVARLTQEMARMLTEAALLAEQAAAIGRRIGVEVPRAEPEPGDWRPRPSTPLREPFPDDPPAVHGNGDPDLSST